MFGTGPIPDLRLGFAETAQKPIGGYSVIDECDLFGALRLVTVVILGGEALEGLGIFAGDDLGWASMPVFRAFMRQTAFPAEEVGPVDNCEFRRFASICLRVAIGN